MELERWPGEAGMIADLYGGVWSRPDEWDRRCTPEGCIVCASGRPYGIIAELEHTWIITDPEVAIFGYVCVISKIHAVGPFDMVDQGVTFWKEAMTVAAALHKMFQPVKMNYEILGNTLPHLHMHLFPRQRDDGFVGRPINLKEVRHRYSDDDLVRLQSVLSSLAQPD